MDLFPLGYNGIGQQFYYTHCHFNIPIQKPTLVSHKGTAKFIDCRSVVARLKHVNWYVGTGTGNQGSSQYSHSHVTGTMFMWSGSLGFLCLLNVNLSRTCNTLHIKRIYTGLASFKLKGGQTCVCNFVVVVFWSDFSRQWIYFRVPNSVLFPRSLVLYVMYWLQKLTLMNIDYPMLLTVK